MRLFNRESSVRGRSRAAFTLLELIVVITIIGILGSLVVYNLRGVGPKARKMKMVNDCKMIVRAAEVMYTESGRYPESIEEMVNARDENGELFSVSLEEFPKDPWGNEYVYEILDNRPTVTCYGSDNQESGEGEAADYTFPEETGSSF